MFQTTLPLEDNSKDATSVGPTTNGHSDGIFGWYRYIQDFTGEFALEWLGRIAQSGDSIWEPFSGSGTTLVAAKLLGYESVGHDISPFMVDVARTKVDWTVCPSSIHEALNDVLNRLSECHSTEPPVGVRVTWDEYGERAHSCFKHDVPSEHLLVSGGIAAVVIGDSAFNGVKIPSDILLAEAAEMEALALEDIEVFRSRWNTKHNIELRESVVLLRKL